MPERAFESRKTYALRGYYCVSIPTSVSLPGRLVLPIPSWQLQRVPLLPLTVANGSVPSARMARYSV
jgi:hypothetical protein